MRRALSAAAAAAPTPASLAAAKAAAAARASSSSSRSRSRAVVASFGVSASPAAAAVYATAAVSRQRCRGATLVPPAPAPQLLRRPRRHARCYSTPTPYPPPLRPDGSTGQPGLGGLAWLCDVAATTALPGDDGDAPGSNGDERGAAALAQLGVRLRRLDVADGQRGLPLLQRQLRGVDGVMVLAGGLRRDGGLPEWVHRRLDLARDVHHLAGAAAAGAAADDATATADEAPGQRRRKPPPPIVCLGGGTPHKPDVITRTGHALHEATACAAYLMATGVAPRALLKETASFDTVGNGLFGLLLHAVPAGWRRVAVVTSAFHMPRSAAVFAATARAVGRSLYGDPDRFALTFLSASDDGVFDARVLAARRDKEAVSLAHWLGVAKTRARTLPELHAWLHSEHLCYAAPRQAEFGLRTIEDARLLESY